MYVLRIHIIMDLDPDPYLLLIDPDADPDPAIFVLFAQPIRPSTATAWHPFPFQAINR
jgi:hypothetical protein